VSLVVYLVVAVLSLYSWAAVLAAYRLISHQAVLRIRIRIHRIHMFLGLPDPDPLFRGTYGSGSGSFYHHAKIVRKP
jgi:hypothetical protein